MKSLFDQLANVPIPVHWAASINITLTNNCVLFDSALNKLNLTFVHPLHAMYIDEQTCVEEMTVPSCLHLTWDELLLNQGCELKDEIISSIEPESSNHKRRPSWLSASKK
jgi:hypothetical protein